MRNGDSDADTDSDAETLAETSAGLTASGTLSVTDADLSDTVSSTVDSVVLSGTDGGLTSGDALGMLTLTPASIAADPGDSQNLSWSFDSGSQAFDFLAGGEQLTLAYTVMADDGYAGTDTQTVTITINGTNDAPMITSNGGVFVPENTTFVTDVDANDPDTGALLNYEILSTSGTDFAAFSIDSSSGVLTFVSPPDFELPNDVGGTPGDNTYLVDVRVSDGLGGTGTQSIAVTVTGSHSVTANDDIVITNIPINDGILIPASALLANDTDSQGHPLHIGNVANATQNGSGDVTYVADNTAGSFDYTASDGEVGSALAHVTVTTQDGVVLGDEGAPLNEILIAGGGDDFLEGYGGNDFLFGGAGADTLYADEGDDTLFGGPGDDYMVGGAGADIFDYNAVSDAETAGDFIEDFNKLDGDQLDLHDLLATFSGYTPETAFSGGYLSVVDSADGALVQVDSDGLGGSGAITLATLNGITANTIDAGDFIL